MNSTFAWFILIILTVASGWISKLENTYVVFLILLFSLLKFLCIAFQFMEMKRAHIFWKTMIVGFLFVFVASIVLVINK